AGHPEIQPATVHVEDRAHPSTSALSENWPRADEWYNFRANPRGRVHVLATVDESTYSGGSMGADYPIAWCQEFAGGRAFYTAGGHTRESWAELLFLAHVAGRERVGIFDVSHMGELELTGEGALAAVQWLTPNDVARLPDGRCQYSAFLTERGTFVDDLLVYRKAADSHMLVVNASNTPK